MISKSSNHVLLNVLPSDHEELPEEKRHAFSDYDLCAPPVMVTLALFFPLSAHADKDQIISNLQGGLSRTLESIPIFAGRLQYDSETQRPYSSQKRHDSVVLGIRYLDEENSSFPSLSQWEEAGFPDGEIAARQEQLFPPGIEPSDLPMGVRIDAGCPIAAFQANFIPGGMILINAFHHYQGDATTCDIFSNAWAENSKALAQPSAKVPTFKPSFDRTYFTKPSSTATEDRVAELKKSVKAMKLVETAPSPSPADPNLFPEPGSVSAASAPTMQMTTGTWHVSSDNCSRLKKLCAPSGEGQYVSTYDCIAALFWRAMMKARGPMYPERNNATQETKLMSAVTIRDRFDVVSKHYVGNGIAASQTEPVSIDALLSGPLGTAALLCRQSILSIKPSTIPEVLELAQAVEGSGRLELDGAYHLGPDVLATSWTKMNVYNYDFGFGLPIGFRAIAPPMDGVVAVYPRCTRRGESEGFEMCTSLEKGCLERMWKDEELLQFCEIRGGGKLE